jgi:hypothetical protein
VTMILVWSSGAIRLTLPRLKAVSWVTAAML